MDDQSTLPTAPTRLDRYARVCERFEVTWRAGGGPRIEDFLEGAEGCERGLLLRELLVAELHLRMQCGDQPAPDAYFKRFPADLSTVENAFAAMSLFDVTVAANGSTAENAPRAEKADRDETDWYPGQTIWERGSGTPDGSNPTPTAPGREPRPAAGADPSSIGRYRVLRCLGAGSAGRVYLAHDEELHRTVAIKVPHRRAFRSSRQVDQFLDEARMWAQLKHPAVVGVHDIGRQPDGSVYIILEYIDGRTLSDVLKAGDLPLERMIGLLALVADAVHHAHRQGLVHRDLKPANILVDGAGNPHIADFGLALSEDVQRLHSGEIAGTAAYMAPEQVRGEAHRLDGRTDVWAIGVILYRVLTGRRPFDGDRMELFDEIVNREPKPPRQINDAIAKELERICLRCMSKRMADRYETALDLAKDLKHWLTSGKNPAEATEGRMRRAVPKGLRAFDGDDAEFFLTLLPGPRGRDGLPESIRFWSTRIEGRDRDAAFSVGLIYGPTGCGKSSFVKAGLLPQLGGRIRPIYVEASPDGTEARLLAALRREFPDLPADLGLSGAAANLRQRQALAPGSRLLIVLDQFEQWLHHNPIDRDSELHRALLQCDGSGLLALLLVRDDFWMAVTRFLNALEVRLVEGGNSAAVELFDAAHAQRVLSDFGRTFGQIPERPDQPGPDAARFLADAARELAGPDGRIIPIRLTLFAEMVRHRPWRPETLRALGGIEGIGVTFLEETFGERSAPLAHRIHLRAARAVLKALLPDPPSDLKGAQRSRRVLQEAAGYSGRQTDFDELLHILDNELRMVTSVDAEKPSDEPAGPPAVDGERSYQLTHDYLVGPLRRWLTRKQKETRTGRAELRLAERTALWTNKPERKQLPNWWEWLDIRAFTSRAEWTAPERKMMRAALGHHLRNSVFLASIVSICFLAFFYTKSSLNEQLIKAQVQEQVEQLWSVDLRYLPRLLDRLDDHPELWSDQVRQHVERPVIGPDQRTRGLLALARRDPAGLDYLLERLLAGEPAELRVLRDELRRLKDRIVPGLWRELLELRATGKRHLAAAAALADYDRESAHWDEVAGQTVRELIAQDPLLVNAWVDALWPVRDRLRPHLVAYFGDPATGQVQKLLLAGILAEYARADDRYLSGEVLAQLLLDANPEQFAIIFPIASRHRSELAERMTAAIGTPVSQKPGEGHEREISRQANAAETLLRLGRGDQFWPLLRQSPDPRLRTPLIDRISSAGVDWETLLKRLAEEQDGSIRQAILLGLEGCGSSLDERDRRRVAERLLGLYETDPDGGVHGAAEWILVKWDFQDQLIATKKRLAGNPLKGNRWFITKQLHTMIVIPRPGTITVGSPGYEPGRDSSETRREATIDHAFAISAHEVSVHQFRSYWIDQGRPTPELTNSRVAFQQVRTYWNDRWAIPHEACPINNVSWFDAARYCRWLSEQAEEGIPEAQRCYPALDQIGSSMRLPDDYLSRTGYRLATEEEWEYAARAGSVTSRFFGSSAEYLDKYAWSANNAGEQIWDVGQKRPNPFGLFDIYGNVAEWCDYGQSERDPRYGKIRGGNYRATPSFHRSAMSVPVDPEGTMAVTGFRIVRTLSPREVEALDTPRIQNDNRTQVFP